MILIEEEFVIDYDLAARVRDDGEKEMAEAFEFKRRFTETVELLIATEKKKKKKSDKLIKSIQNDKVNSENNKE